MKFRIPLLALACGLNAWAQMAPEDMPLDIAVRSEIDRPFEGWGKAAVIDHGQVYQIATVTDVSNELRLVRPVNEQLLVQSLQRELNKRGFRPASAEEPPEIILTVSYGRGFLKNPYLDGAMPQDMGDPPIVSITGATMKQFMNRFKAGWEAKLQDANYEKLFIHISAWANPADQPPPKHGQKLKPKKLWNTTIMVDDPGHRDMNQFIKKMLAAGSEFFDREMDEEEAFVRTDLPEGYVHFGETIIMPAKEGDEK